MVPPAERVADTEVEMQRWSERSKRSQRRATRAAVAAMAFAMAAAPGAEADDVHLRNGSSFEDVVAVRTETHVVVELPEGGRLRLPNDQVLEVVERSSALQRFREYRDRLLEHPGSSGEDLLDLVRWAQLNGLAREARSLALVLARARPELEGLEPLLAASGYVRDDRGAWVLHDELMRSRGLVPHDGEWITPEQRAAAWAVAAPGPLRRGGADDGFDDRGGDRPSDNEVALESIRLARSVVEQQGAGNDREPRAGGAGHPVAAVVGGYAVVPGGSSSEAYQAYRAQIRADIEALSRRQPGSILPLSTFRAGGED
ncbi:MAG: hypothetical protein DWQ36_05515 [Acidobacteria bacterium]|nr:MAG: hypothetical protein DWQ36_05515 [Acidobacteriota bacterium]